MLGLPKLHAGSDTVVGAAHPNDRPGRSYVSVAPKAPVGHCPNCGKEILFQVVLDYLGLRTGVLIRSLKRSLVDYNLAQAAYVKYRLAGCTAKQAQAKVAAEAGAPWPTLQRHVYRLTPDEKRLIEEQDRRRRAARARNREEGGKSK